MSTRGLSVCHVLNTVGETSIVIDIAEQQLSHHAIDSVGFIGWNGIDGASKLSQFETFSLDLNGSLYLSPAEYRTAKSLLSEYDVIHTHRNHSGFYAKLIAKRLGKPVFVTDHNNHTGFTLKGRIANTLTNIFADNIICVSESVFESWAPWERLPTTMTDVSIIHNGVDLSLSQRAEAVQWRLHDECNIEPESIVVGSAGMLTEQKAHEVLLDAVEQANDRCEQSVEVVISGDGPRRDALEQRIDASRHSDKLHLLGFLNDKDHVFKMMDDVDIYAMPSRWEGLCVAALEAMAIGNPCVFSDIDEFVRPFADASLYHAVDDADSLADRIIEFVQNPQLRDEYRGKAQTLVRQQFSIEQTANQYVDLYTQCLGNRE